MIAAVALAASAGCATAPGTGWSRAPDLSVYSTMNLYARVAWEQQVLCDGVAPDRASALWARDYSGRQAAVTAALEARHGADAVGRAVPPAMQRVPCGDLPDLAWRERYARLLHLLEIRLDLAPERAG